jgi:hypothetical protein
MSSTTDSIAENISVICDRVVQSRDPKAIAQTIKSIPDISKAAFAAMYIASELSLTDTGFKMLGRIQIELLKD